LRSSGKTSSYVADQGIFQQTGSGYIAHLIRLKVSEELHCVPEISANKSAINIRFFPSEPRQKIKVVENDIAFELTFCHL